MPGLPAPAHDGDPVTARIGRIPSLRRRSTVASMEVKSHWSSSGSIFAQSTPNRAICVFDCANACAGDGETRSLVVVADPEPARRSGDEQADDHDQK